MSLQDFSHATSDTSTSTLLPGTAREVQERLERSDYRALRHISCIASDDGLYLHGSLPSHYLKQVAQEIASRVDGVYRVINRILVSTPARRAQLDRLTFDNPSN
ncbi:MAG: BON domain-containing protein [Isosphaeraceae bacterium]